MSKSKARKSSLNKAQDSISGTAPLLRFRSRHFAAAGLAAITAFLVYLPALDNGFVKWDDPAYILDNLNIHSLNLFFLKWAFFDFYAANWHPLTWLSHAIDYAIWGMNPRGHHFTNILLHGINVFWVVLVSIQLISSAKKRGNPLPDRIILTAGIITGLLFGLHPVHVESVAWVSERKDVLCAFFFLLSLIFYIKYALSSSTGTSAGGYAFLPSNGSYLRSLVFYSLALMSKPMALVMPVVLLIIDWYPLERFQRGRIMTVLSEKIPFFSLAFVSFLITLRAQHSGNAIKLLTDYPMSTRILNGFYALFGYIGHMLWPVGLSPFYPYPRNVSLLSPVYIVAFLSALVVTILAVILSKKRKIWLATWMYYSITLIPVLGIIQVGLQSMADRYLYLPALSLFLLTGIGSAMAVRRFLISQNIGLKLAGAGFAAGLLVIVILMSVATVQQIHVWKDTVSLWSRVAEFVSPKDEANYMNSHLIFFNLGSALTDQGRLEDAVKATRKAISLKPDFYSAHYNLANIYSKQNRLDDAVKEYQIALSLQPDSYDIHINLGVAYKKQNQYAAAISEFQKVLSLNPDSPEAHINLGVVYISQNRLEDALREFQVVMRLKPGHAMAYINAGIVYRRQSRYVEAISEFQEVLGLRPDFAEAHYELGVTYRDMKRPEDAIKEFQSALKLKPDLIMARNNLNLLITEGQLTK